jgi:hypothetical protein
VALRAGHARRACRRERRRGTDEVRAPDPYTVVDLQLSRSITKWGEVFLAFENILDGIYAVQRTTDGIVTVGNPRLIRGGVRLIY